MGMTAKEFLCNVSWSRKDLTCTEDLSLREIDEIFALADIFKAEVKKDRTKLPYLKGKTVVNLFFEPSTRTRTAFEMAAHKLGADVISFSSSISSSVKGETLKDTARNIEALMADMIIVRHSSSGAAKYLADRVDIPVINAGDGGHNPPTQTLADLLTIKREKGGFSGITIGFCGDLKFGRTVHSLINALARYENVKFILISPEELKLPSYVKNVIKEKNLSYVQTTNLESVMGELDVLYMTRVQKERFFNEEDYLRLKDSYILTPEKLLSAREDMIVMHPLPRVNEISVAVDSDPRACYFKQVLNGKYMRMALIKMLLEV